MEYEKLYGFTIKDTHTPEALLSEETYQTVIRSLIVRGDVDQLVYERHRKDGTKARLHVHGTIRFTRVPLLTSLIPKGYSFLFEKINDYKTWSKYCSKRQHSDQDYYEHFRSVVY